MADREKIILDTELDGEPYGLFYYGAEGPVYSATRVERLLGVFASQPIDATSELLSWKDLFWTNDRPANTRIYVYLRSSSSLSAIENQPWTGPFLNGAGEDISSLKDRYFQVRIVLFADGEADQTALETPKVMTLTASAFVLGNESIFYSETFDLGFKVDKLLLTFNGTISEDTLLQFAISGQDSIDIGDFQLITPNTIEDMDQISEVSENMKILIRAVGSLEAPFIVDEFAVTFSGPTDDDQELMNFDE